MLIYLARIMKTVARVRVESPVYPTEDAAKVKAACLNVFPDLAFTAGADGIVGEGSDLDRLRELVRNQKIRDTARDVLVRGRRGFVVRFSLNKQAAFVGRVNFAGGTAPLGDIAVVLEDPDTDALIEHLAESTIGHRLTGSRGRIEGT